jgi:hypothetical protein
VGAERLSRIVALFDAAGERRPAVRLCEVCVEASVMTGGGVMLMSGDVPQGSVCSSNAVSALIEELQFTMGEGPCVDAYHQDRPVAEPDLADPAVPRWLGFTPPALAAGARAVFGFPLRVGAVRLGALNFYRDRPGPMSDDQHADALVLAEVAARTVLDLQAGAQPGELADALQAGSDFRYVVHQAAGMVSVQLGVSIAEALIRLRAHAFTTNRRLSEIAAEVVDRRLRLE